MYFNTKLFLRAEYLALFGRGFRLRRWVYVIGFSCLFGAMCLIVALGRLLDHMLYPGFRRQPVRAPVFIIAPPRSGTTLLQKLMALDEEQFVHAKLYQTIFPSVTWQKLLDGFACLDRWCGGPLAKLMRWSERKWFGGWDDMHKMRFAEPEEDDGFFVYTFVTEAIYLLFPFVDELWEAGFADALPRRERRKLMAYYRSCLQRQLFAHGPAKGILSKATQSCGSIEALLEEFPDARFITIVRHPFQSVASHVSVFYPVWQAHWPDLPRNSPVSEAYARLAVEWYRHLHEMSLKIDPRQFHRIDYRDLIRDPCRTIENAYTHFDLEMTEVLKARVAGASNRQRDFKSVHHYSLEEFGLSRQWIQQQLGDVLSAYGLES